MADSTIPKLDTKRPTNKNGEVFGMQNRTLVKQPRDMNSLKREVIRLRMDEHSSVDCDGVNNGEEAEEEKGDEGERERDE